MTPAGVDRMPRPPRYGRHLVNHAQAPPRSSANRPRGKHGARLRKRPARPQRPAPSHNRNHNSNHGSRGLSSHRPALQHGQALGSGFAYPVTLTQVAQWAQSVESRGYQLAPASALTTRR